MMDTKMSREPGSYEGPNIPSAFATRSYEHAEFSRPRSRLLLKLAAGAMVTVLLFAVVVATV